MRRRNKPTAQYLGYFSGADTERKATRPVRMRIVRDAHAARIPRTPIAHNYAI